MNADSAFLIGATHAVCQDYAVARNGAAAGPDTIRGLLDSPYVILSDGCSSSPDTDIGARLLVKAAEQTLLASAEQTAAGGLPSLHAEAASRALVWAELMGVRPQAVDATLLTAHLYGEELLAACSGDGVVVLQSKEGAIDAYVISYLSGYPLYPSYRHQPARLLALPVEGRAGKEVRRFRCASVEEPLRLMETKTSDSVTEVFAVRAAEYRCAALFSDGIHSFFAARRTETSSGIEAIPLSELIRELIAFKCMAGAFVGRRLKRFMKECRSRGWQHTDDLAMGALDLGD